MAIISFDFDNTLAKSNEGLIAYINNTVGKDNPINPLDYEYDYASNYEINWDEALEFYRLTSLKDGMADLVRLLKEQGHELYIVTARDDDGMGALKETLLLYGLKDMFTIYNTAGETKVKVYDEIHPTIIIDDHVKDIVEAQEAGYQVIIMDEPYNRSLNGFRAYNGSTLLKTMQLFLGTSQPGSAVSLSEIKKANTVEIQEIKDFKEAPKMPEEGTSVSLADLMKRK